MIIGLLVMLVILSPILKLIDGKTNFKIELFKESSSIEKEDLKYKVEHLHEVQDKQVIEVYKKKLEKYIEDKIQYEHKVHVIRVTAKIEEDRKSEAFGSIKSLNILLPENLKDRFLDKKDKTIPTISINLDINESEEQDIVTTEENSAIVEEITKNISALYDLNRNQIQVSLCKEK